jgi:hypothetical protein
MAARAAIIRAEKRQEDARERLAKALDAHSSFLQARIAASRRIGASDGRGKAATSAEEQEEDLDNPRFLKRKLPGPSEGWKDSSGKPHRAHASSAAFCKRAAWIAWRLLDVLRESAEADPLNHDPRSRQKDVKLLKLIPLEVLKEKEGTIKVRLLLEYLLNDINEYSTALFLRHVHGQAVADLFAGDDLYGVDLSLPIHERVDKAKKQVAKEHAQATLAAAARGVSSGVGKRSGGRGKGGRRQQRQQQPQQRQQQQFNNQQQQGGRGGGGGGGNGGTGGVVGGATGGWQPPVCYGCGASGHFQRNCPNK